MSGEFRQYPLLRKGETAAMFRGSRSNMSAKAT
jgi:hypothetical protein